MNRWNRAFGAVLASLMLSLTATVVAAPQAHAASCWGDWCSNTDPQATGCANDAYTVSTAYLYGTNNTVELRWSPTCKTNWARISSGGWGSGDVVKAVQRSTGYTMSGYVGDNGVYKWTRQIYSPTKCVYGYWNKWNWGVAQTACA